MSRSLSSRPAFTSRLHLPPSPPAFTSRLHLPPSPPAFTSRLHLPPSPPAFTSRLHLPPSPPAFTSRLHLPPSPPAFTSRLHLPPSPPSIAFALLCRDGKYSLVEPFSAARIFASIDLSVAAARKGPLIKSAPTCQIDWTFASFTWPGARLPITASTNTSMKSAGASAQSFKIRIAHPHRIGQITSRVRSCSEKARPHWGRLGRKSRSLACQLPPQFAAFADIIDR